MASKSTLTSKTMLYGIAFFFERSISLLVLPILTKNFPQEMYGIWTQIVLSTSLLTGIVLIGLHTASVKYLAGGISPRELSRLFHQMLVIVLANCTLVLFVVLKYRVRISDLIFGNKIYSDFVVLFGLLLIGEVLFELLVAFLRARNRIGLLSFYYILKNAIRLGVLILGTLVYHADLYTMLMWIVIALAVFTATIYLKDILAKYGLILSHSLSRIKEILIFSLPLTPYGILIWFNMFVCRYFILHILGMAEVSVYAVAYSLMSVVAIFYAILGFTVYPQMAEMWNEGSREYVAETLKRAIEYFMLFSIPVVASTTIFKTPLISILATGAYETQYQVMLLIGISVIALGLFNLNIYALLVTKRTVMIVVLVAIATAVNIFLNALTVPMYGIYGAAISTFVSNGILAVLTVVIARRCLPYKFPWLRIGKVSIATVIMVVFVLFAGHFFDWGKRMDFIFGAVIAVSIYCFIELLDRDSLLRGIIGSLRSVAAAMK